MHLITKLLFGIVIEEPYCHTVKLNRRNSTSLFTLKTLLVGIIGAITIITIGTYIRHANSKPPFTIIEIVSLSVLMGLIPIISNYSQLFQNRMIFVKRKHIKIWDGKFGSRIIRWENVNSISMKVHGKSIRLSINTNTLRFNMITRINRTTLHQVAEIDKYFSSYRAAC
jgi:hypothetical protein